MNISAESVGTIATAYQVLAGVCDGARMRDDVGFNGTDTKFGHRMSVIPSDDWTVDMLVTAAKVIHKYSGQLSMSGIDISEAYAEIMASAYATDNDLSEVSKTGHRQAWEKEYAITHAPTAEIKGNMLFVRNSFTVRDELTPGGFEYNKYERAHIANLGSLSAHTVLGIPAIRMSDETRVILSLYPAPAPREIVPERINITVNPNGDNLIMWTKNYGDVPITVIRAIPGRTWSAKAGVNYIDACSVVIDLVQTYNLTISDDARALIEANRQAEEDKKRDSDIREAKSRAMSTDDMSMALADVLRDYQRAGVAYSLDKFRPYYGRTLNADEMGLGKTWETISTLETEQAYPAVITCPSSLVLNWVRELKNLIPHRTVKVFTFRMMNPGDFKVCDTDITIMPYGVLDSYVESFPPLKGFVCDESHYIKEGKARRTKAVLNVCGKEFDDKGMPIPSKLTDDAHVIFMTGTPILNRPMELIQPLRALGILSDHPSASIEGTVAWFKYQFCGAADSGYRGRVSFKGASNTEALHAWLRQTCMFRRRKVDVLTDLPAKTRSLMPTELDKKARALYERLGQEGAERAAETRAEAIVYLNALRQAVGNAKIDHAIAWITEFLDTDKQLIVFAKHKNVQNGIINALRDRDINVTHILGGQAQELTEAHKAAFQSGESRVIVLSLDAAREGHTLTAASDILFTEQGWNPGTHNQAEDRAHRIGQTEPVTAWYLVALDTIDEWLYELIEAKRLIVNGVNDGDAYIDDSEESIMKQVLDRSLARYGVKRRWED